jgi:hypothetical protein
MSSIGPHTLSIQFTVMFARNALVGALTKRLDDGRTRLDAVKCVSLTNVIAFAGIPEALVAGRKGV